MFICSICGIKENSVAKLTRHIEWCHKLSPSFEKYTCGQSGCQRTFNLKDSFRKHLFSHKVQTNSSIETHVQINSIQTSSYDESRSFSADGYPPLEAPEIEPPTEKIAEVPVDQSLKLLSALYANPLVPRQAIQTVVDGVKSLISDDFIPKISKILLDAGVSDAVFQEVVSAFSHHPIHNLDTEFKRVKLFEQQGWYVPPQEIIIGQRLNDSRPRGNFSLTPISCVEHFIPLSSVLRLFFSIPNLLKETFNFINEVESNGILLTNILQGSTWQNKKKNHGDKIVFPLIMFFDDYETGNVLGSHAGCHKLGAVYVSVGCLPPHYASNLQNIFLTLLTHSSDRVNFGNAVVFQPVINELKNLQEKGIQLNLPDFRGTIYFELAAIVGDNLGLHQITGFVESFSAKYPCRICSIEKEKLGTLCTEDVTLLRSLENYDESLQTSSVGVKEKCVWHQIPGFDVLSCVGVDLMHDILEGTAVYVLSFLIDHYINSIKLFSLEVLNQRIFAFDYGPDHTSKPTAVTEEHLKRGHVKLSASEMLTFVRYFGLITGDLIPIDEPTWALYSTLRQMLDIIMSRTVSKGSNDLMRTLISEHNELYLKYSKKKLKPKFHFLLHYPRMAEKFGPLSNLWSMRFEAKHRVSKISARASFSRRNITKTLAVRHQLQLVNTFNTNRLTSAVKFAKKTPVREKYVNSIASLPLPFNQLDDLFSVSWAIVKGTKYSKNTVLSVKVSPDGPEFGIINEIFILPGPVVAFSCKILRTIGFDSHVHCYEVSETNEDQMFLQSELPSPIPNTLSVTPRGNKMVTMRDPL